MLDDVGQAGHGRYSISERPVSRRKTSSSVDRRTSTVSGSSPRSCAATATASPSSAYRRTRSASRSIRSARPSSWPFSVSWTPAGKRSSVTSLVEYRSISWRGRTLGDDLRLVHDDEAVAELLGLVHVVGGQDQRHATLLQPVEAVPEQVTRLRVEAGRRLVEEEQGRLVDQRPGDRQPPLHPARQRLDLVVLALGQLGELQQLVRAPVALGPRQAEVAPVEDEVLADGQLGVEAVLLGDDADPRADPRPVGRRAPGRARSASRPTPARRSRSSASSRSCRRHSARGTRTIRPGPRRNRWRRRR